MLPSSNESGYEGAPRRGKVGTNYSPWSKLRVPACTSTPGPRATRRTGSPCLECVSLGADPAAGLPCKGAHKHTSQLVRWPLARWPCRSTTVCVYSNPLFRARRGAALCCADPHEPRNRQLLCGRSAAQPAQGAQRARRGRAAHIQLRVSGECRLLERAGGRGGNSQHGH